MSSLLALHRLHDPANEPWPILRARERQFLAAQPTLHGHAPDRLALLEQWTGEGIVADDAEVAEFDAWLREMVG
jgi:hypothetical protein